MKYKIKGKIDNLDIVKQVCETRGVDYSNLELFLNPKEWVRSNPAIYNNMVKVAEIIIEAVKKNLNIGILIDSDCDGYLSSAMVVNYLNDVLGFNGMRFYMHENKEHGLTPYIMNQIKQYPPQLLIIPDASSSDWVQHQELWDMGVKTVIIDHHEAEGYSPFALVVNNQLQEESNKTLSAGGMVMKLLEQMDIILGEDKAKNYCDLASVSLVGDCMLMNHPETRYYVQQGLLNINNPLLEELIRAEGERSYETISFDIAPTINAFIRMGNLQERQEVFLALIGNRALREITIRGQGKFELPLPEYISKMASRIKSRQTTAVKKALESENTLISSEELNIPITVCILDDEVSKSLTGLIGNRLTEIYKKPAIVLKRTKEGFLAGSGRTTDTFPDFKDYCNELGFFEFCAGHQGAFGVGITESKLNELYINTSGKTLGEDFDCYMVDKAYENNVSAFDIMAIGELNRYWSRGFDKPLFYVKLTNLTGAEVEIIGQKRNTIRIKKDNITYLKFKCEPEEIEAIQNKIVKEVELVGHFAVNEYYDNLYPQVIIENLEYSGEDRVKEGFGFDFSNFNIQW